MSYYIPLPSAREKYPLASYRMPRALSLTFAKKNAFLWDIIANLHSVTIFCNSATHY